MADFVITRSEQMGNGLLKNYLQYEWPIEKKNWKLEGNSCNKIPDSLSSPQDAHASHPHRKVIMMNPWTHKGGQSSGEQHIHTNKGIRPQQRKALTMPCCNLSDIFFFSIQWHILERHKHPQLTMEQKCCK